MSSKTPVNFSESRQESLMAANIITYVFAVTAVSLRFWSRRLTRAGFWIDDWMMLAAVITAAGLFADLSWLITSVGYGRHIEALGPDASSEFLLGLFISALPYTFAIVLVKYSILALYMRLFGRTGHTSIRIPIWIIMAIVTCWGLALLILSIFTCIPPQGFWDKSIDAKCTVDTQKLFYSISLPNILTDVILLALPMPYIFKLNVSWSQKRLLIGTFLLGSFVCIACIMRSVSVLTLVESLDLTWNWVDIGLWVIIETNLAIVSACLPVLKPIYYKIFKPKQNTPESAVVAQYSGTIGSGPSKRRVRREWLEMPTIDTVDNTASGKSLPAIDEEECMFSTHRAASSESTARLRSDPSYKDHFISLNEVEYLPK